MPAPKTTTPTGLAQRVRGNALLTEMAQPFPKLAGSKGDLAGGFKKMGKALAGSKRTGAIQFTIREGRRTRRWCLTLTPGGCDVAESATSDPDLEILTDAATWFSIASGSASPLEAFGSGRVRVRGDIRLARVLARSVRA